VSINVSNLFDIEGAETEAALLTSAARHLHFQELKGAKKMKHGAVVDRTRLGGVVRQPESGARPSRNGKRSGSKRSPP
jgi:hypothetical protein